MSVALLISLGLIAVLVARTTVNHPLVLAAALVGASWASPSRAVETLDARFTTRVEMALFVAEDVSATTVRVDPTDGKAMLQSGKRRLRR